MQADVAVKDSKVMIVDDDPTTVELVRFQLSQAGYANFIECFNARDALRLVEEENPDVILLDLVMPETNGLDVLDAIRSKHTSVHLPVIILTAVEHKGIKMNAFERGATDFINKPVNFVELAPRVRNSLLVKTYHDKLQKHADDLQYQVELKTAHLKASHTKLKKTNQILRRSCTAAKAATNAKSDFLANVSHELRTPLTAVIGFTEELLSVAADVSLPDGTLLCRCDEVLPIILSNGRHLLQIVNNILDVATIEKGQLTIERVDFSPKVILDEVVHLLKPAASSKGIELVADNTSPMPEVIHSDPMRLRQILINIIANAVKFTEEGSVRVLPKLLAAEGSNPALQFEVIDTGIGIEQAQIDEIFKPFIQSQASNGGKYDGTGLGLTICDYLAKELGGQVQAESRPGVGSTFKVTVATGLLKSRPLESRPVQTKNMCVNGRCETGQENPAQEQLGKDCLRDRRVLLVEDAPDNQRLISFILKKAGAQVTIADNGRIALDEIHDADLRDEHFDIIITDIQMPVLDGYELTKHLRQDDYRGSIVALTANAMAGEQQKCLTIGCDDYLSKPIDRGKLLAMVARHSDAAFRSRQPT